MVARIVLFNLFFFFTSFLKAQEIIGYWDTYLQGAELPVSQIEFFEKDGFIDGRVIKIYDRSLSNTCDNCTGPKKGEAIIGMTVIWDLKKSGRDKYKKGKKVTVYYNPRNAQEAVLEPGSAQGTLLSLAVSCIPIIAGIIQLMTGFLKIP